jgi:hypothetical protein
MTDYDISEAAIASLASYLRAIGENSAAVKLLAIREALSAAEKERDMALTREERMNNDLQFYLARAVAEEKIKCQ